jgi:mono/diheme cytochrome c family protein
VRADLMMRRGAQALLLAAAPFALSACDWFTTFRHQPRLEPWENMAISPDTNVKYYWAKSKGIIGIVGKGTADENGPDFVFRGNPQGSVPVTGTYLAEWQVSRGALPGVIDSIGNAVTNPVPPSDSSLALGRRYFQINCAACHGDDGQGAKTIIAQYGLAINIVGDVTKNRSDGYIYGMIRNGRGLMPSYNRIEEQERWHVVNYVRGLQGKLGKEVAKGPVGFPGQTGFALPGATATAPTRPSPFAKPAHASGVDVRGGEGGDAAAKAGATAKEKN